MARKILLADDSVTAQNMGRRILTEAGYEVVTVNNGSAALKKAAEQKPDLIILDVYMPGYTGLEVCQRLKEASDTFHIPVLLTVGKLEPFKADEAKRVRADAHLVKPFEASELLTAITKLEDKIVPAAPAPRVKADHSRSKPPETFSDLKKKEESFGDQNTGWKSRLTIPTSAPKTEEPAPEIAAAAASARTAFRDFSRREEPAAASSQTGMVGDVTAEEIAAIAAAAAAVDYKTDERAAAESGSPFQDGRPAHIEAVAEPAPVAEVPPAGAQPAAEAGLETFAAAAAATEPEPAPALEVMSYQPAERSTPIWEFASPFSSVATEEAQEESVAEVQPEAAEAVAEQAPASQAYEAVEEVSAPEERTPEPVAEIVAEPAAIEIAEAPVEAAQAEPEAQPASEESSAVAEPAQPVADDELIAALDSLAPMIAPVNGNGVGAAAMHARAESSSYTGPRWIAAEVAVEESEAALVLEREMEKAYAAMADGTAFGTAPEQASSVGVSELQEVPATDSSPSLENAMEAAGAGISEPPALHADAQPIAAVEASRPVEAFQAVAEVEASEESQAALAAIVESQPIAAVSESRTPVTEETPAEPVHEIALAAAAAAGAGSSAVDAISEAAVTAAPESSTAPVETEREAELAAAWAHWRQIRETISEPALTEHLATAAAAAAEFRDIQRSTPESPAGSSAGTEPAAPADPAAIASIVDSVLSELRPKLVQEIARKLGEKK